MAVLNIDPNSGAHFGPGEVHGLANVYCVGPGASNFGIKIMAPPPPPWTMHNLQAGHMITFQVDDLELWLYNWGPSRIQLLYNPDEEGMPGARSVEEAEGAEALAEPAASYS